jgi:hypothetical protein
MGVCELNRDHAWKTMDRESLLLSVEVIGEDLNLQFVDDQGQNFSHKSRVWSHTVYELENLSVALRLMANRSQSKVYCVPSADVLIGPNVAVSAAMWVNIGHPGINRGFDVATVHLSGLTRPRSRGGQWVVILDVTCQGRCASGMVDAESAIPFAEELYREAKELSRRFIDQGPTDNPIELGGILTKGIDKD